MGFSDAACLANALADCVRYGRDVGDLLMLQVRARMALDHCRTCCMSRASMLCSPWPSSWDIGCAMLSVPVLEGAAGLLVPVLLGERRTHAYHARRMCLDCSALHLDVQSIECCSSHVAHQVQQKEPCTPSNPAVGVTQPMYPQLICTPTQATAQARASVPADRVRDSAAAQEHGGDCWTPFIATSFQDWRGGRGGHPGDRNGSHQWSACCPQPSHADCHGQRVACQGMGPFEGAL
jgi:hypothetical protein